MEQRLLNNFDINSVKHSPYSFSGVKKGLKSLWNSVLCKSKAAKPVGYMSLGDISIKKLQQQGMTLEMLVGSRTDRVMPCLLKNYQYEKSLAENDCPICLEK
jgi:hypothetical protein